MAAQSGCTRTALGTLLGLVVWAWTRTLRVTLEADLAEVGRRRVFAFLHGQQMALLAAPWGPVVVLVSLSRDGAIQASVMRRLGFLVVRGSSSRGGVRGLAGIVRELSGGADAAFAVDGPRGPRGVPKPGAALAASLTGAELVPVATAAARSIVVSRAWDAFEIPLPFTRVAIVAGAAVRATAARSDPEVLGAALRGARARAERIVGCDSRSASLARGEA